MVTKACVLTMIDVSQTSVGTITFFMKSGVDDFTRHKQVFAVVLPLYVLALVLLSQFRDMFPSNILLIMLLTSLSSYVAGFLTSYWQ